jgi:hypothetical protein
MHTSLGMPRRYAISRARPPSTGAPPLLLAAFAQGQRAGIDAGAALAASLGCGTTQPLMRPGLDECARAAIEAGVKCAIAANVASRLSACLAAVIPYAVLSRAGAQAACEAARRLVQEATDRSYAAVRDQAVQAGLQALANVPQPIEPDRLDALLSAAVAAGIAAGIEQGSRRALRAAVVEGMNIGLRMQLIAPAPAAPNRS